MGFWDHVKANAVSIGVGLVMAGATWATLGWKLSDHGNQITDMKTANASLSAIVSDLQKDNTETKLRITINSGSIQGLQADNRSAQKDIAEIKASIGVLSTKLDNVIDLLKKK